MLKSTQLTFILAMDRNCLIGNKNDLPWKLPADLLYFKRKTLNKTLLMGRKTCQSLPFVLPKRRNIVLTRNIDFHREGFECINTLDSINELDDEIMVIGGAMIYRLLMPYASKLLITHIDHEFSGDTHFEWQPKEWKVNSKINHTPDSKNEFPYSFVEYVRAN